MGDRTCRIRSVTQGHLDARGGKRGEHLVVEADLGEGEATVLVPDSFCDGEVRPHRSEAQVGGCGHRLGERNDLAGVRPDPVHSGVDLQMDVDRAPATLAAAESAAAIPPTL